MTVGISALAQRYAMQHSDAPFALAGIDHAVLLVEGMERALEFYCNVLGCRPGFSYPELAMEQVWCGASLIVLIDIADPKGAKSRPLVKGGRNMDHLALAIGQFDAEALRGHLAAHGIEIEREAFHGGARGMGAAIYIRDPSDNVIELKGPPVY